jgi:preprotein translocase subunit Sec63
MGIAALWLVFDGSRNTEDYPFTINKGWIVVFLLTGQIFTCGKLLRSIFIAMNTNTGSFTNYYSLFGLSEHATYEDIKKKYNALALTHHPDRNQGKNSPLQNKLT